MNNFNGLKKIFKTFKTEKTVKVLKNISQKFDKGKSYSIMGPSGSGKSTLLNLISLIDRPSSGSVHFDKIPVNFNESEKNDVYILFQAPCGSHLPFSKWRLFFRKYGYIAISDHRRHIKFCLLNWKNNVYIFSGTLWQPSWIFKMATIFF